MKLDDLNLTIINNLSDGIYFVDVDRRITFWNNAAEEITGYKKEEIIGQPCHSDILNHISKEGHPLCVIGCPLFETIVDGKHRSDEVLLRHKDGHRIPVIVKIIPIVENDVIIGAIEIFKPNSPIVYDDKLIEKLSQMAMNDQLTGLANRRKMESYLEYRFHELKRFGRKFCVIFFDVDDFRAFNNIYGHEVGDNVLKAVSKSINHSMRSSDLFGRWGGEEFVGVFEIKNDKDADLIAEKIRVLVAGTEIPFAEKNLFVTASIGVTLAREDDNIKSIIKRADALMYKSKSNNKNCVTSDVI